jgi:hypothetical protein
MGQAEGGQTHHRSRWLNPGGTGNSHAMKGLVRSMGAPDGKAGFTETQRKLSSLQSSARDGLWFGVWRRLHLAYIEDHPPRAETWPRGRNLIGNL